MNPRLIKFAVELQNGEKVEEEKKDINCKSGGDKKFFDIIKQSVKITVPINKN